MSRRSILASAGVMAVVAVVVSGVARPAHSSVYRPCLSTCVSCGWPLVMYSDGYGPDGYNDASEPNPIACEFDSCDNICGSEELAAEVREAARSRDVTKLRAILAQDKRVRFNSARQAIQVETTCSGGAIVFSTTLDVRTIAALTVPKGSHAAVGF